MVKKAESELNNADTLSWLEPLYCLLHENQYPISQEELYQISEKQGDNEPLNKEDVEFVTTQLRLDPVWQKISWKKIHFAELPALLLLTTGESVVLKSLQSEHATISVLRNGEVSQTNVNINSLKKAYSGQLLTINREQTPVENVNKISISEWISKKALTYAAVQVLIASLVINIFQLALPLYTMNVYDKVLLHQAEETLWVLFGGIMIILILDYIFRLMRGVILENVSERFGEALLMRLMRKTSHMDLKQSEEVGAVADTFQEMNSYRGVFFCENFC